MASVDPLADFLKVAEAPEFRQANVTPITVGDLAVLRDTFAAWNEPRTYCAVCMEPFSGVWCPTCGIPRRTER